MVPLSPCCVTVNVRVGPAAGEMVMVAVRVVVDVLAAAAQLMVASAVPDEGEVRVSHVWLIDVVHCKVELFVVNENDPVPPLAAAVAEDGLIAAVVAACVSTKVTAVPFIGVTVIVAIRSDVVVLPVAVY